MVLRLAVAASLVTLLVSWLDMERAGQMLASIDLGWLAGGMLIIVGVRALNAIRWKIILAGEGIREGFWYLLRVIFISLFIGYFLPGVLGADVVRGYRIVRDHGKMGAVTKSLVLDRVIGIYGTLVVALAGAVVVSLAGPTSPFLIPLAIAQLAVVAGWLLARGLTRRLERVRLAGRPRLARLWTKVLSVVSVVTDARRLRALFAPITGLSVAVALARCAIFYCLYRSFGVVLPAGVWVLNIPLMFVAILVPVSIGGLGVRESALIFLFRPWGVEAEVSASVGIIFQLLQIVASIPGAWFWMVDDRTPPGASRAGEEQDDEVVLSGASPDSPSSA